MSSTLIATDAVDQVYARSLFELAQAEGRERLDEVFEELEQIVELIRSTPRFREFLRSPLIDAKRREAALRNILKDRVSSLVERFLLLVARKGRLKKLEGIVAAFQSLYYNAFGTMELDVWTASRLGEAQAAHLEERLAAVLKREIVVHYYVDPEMIGGIRVRSGDSLFDASISAQLRRLRQAIDEAGTRTLRERARDMFDA